jgi:hypothetical protein
VLKWRRIVSGSAALLAAVLFVPNVLFSQERGVDSADTYASQTSPGEVRLDITPVWEGGDLSFQVSANTHSVDLSGLRLDEGMRLMVRDTEWEPTDAGVLAGHHARTTVRFRLPSRPESFVLEIRDVPDVPVRRLVWPEASDNPDP